MLPFQLTDETALITGGGTGLGLGMARAMVGAGARVVLVGRRGDVLARAAQELGPMATWEACDVTRPDQATALIERIESQCGPLSILVNNAGIHLKKRAVDVVDAEFAAVLETNLHAPFRLAQAALPGMIERGRGNILFIASMASLFGIPLVSAYAAAKTGLLGIVRTLAVEASPHGVRVNAIAPGWIDSEMLRGAMDADPNRRAKVLGRTPMGCFGTPEDIGWAAVYLCSSAARFVTGAVLPVDGGVSIGF